MVATPALDAILNRSQLTLSPGSSLEEAVLTEFGVTLNTSSIAAITANVDMPNANLPQPQTWLRADPAHFAVSRDNVQLFDSHVVKPTVDEMAAITASLNRHFAEDGLTVTFPDPARGYVAIDAHAVPITTPLWKMGGANVFDHLPSSEGKTNWRALGNEIQMLLHDHPVNQAREARGALPINGLWFWGGSAVTTADFLIPPPQTRYTKMVGKLVLARGLAVLAGLDVMPLGATFAETVAFSSPQSLPSPGVAGATSALSHKRERGKPDTAASTLIVLHSSTREVRAQAPESWAQEVATVDRNWIAPAVAAFDRGDIAAITIIIANENKTLMINTKHNSTMLRLSRFFSTPKTLNYYA